MYSHLSLAPLCICTSSRLPFLYIFILSLSELLLCPSSFPGHLCLYLLFSAGCIFCSSSLPRPSVFTIPCLISVPTFEFLYLHFPSHALSLPLCPAVFRCPAFCTSSAACTFERGRQHVNDSLSSAHLSTSRYISFSCSLQVYMSCGCMEDLPCSGVGHIYRKCSLYKLPGGIRL